MSGQMCSHNLIERWILGSARGGAALRTCIGDFPFITTTTALCRCAALGMFRHK
ncbi:MAG: hypothetical protein PVJ26_17220 [Anaerolineae bacterium]